MGNPFENEEVGFPFYKPLEKRFNIKANEGRTMK